MQLGQVVQRFDGMLARKRRTGDGEDTVAIQPGRQFVRPLTVAVTQPEIDIGTIEAARMIGDDVIDGDVLVTAQKALMRGISHRCAIAIVQPMVTLDCPPDVLTCRKVDEIRSNPSLRAAAIVSPSRVSSSARCRRRNSGLPSSSSSMRICFETAPTVTLSSSAAFVRLR